jgi:hypothetical protein
MATAGFAIQITPSLNFEFGRRKGDISTNNYATLILKLPYSENEKFTDFKISMARMALVPSLINCILPAKSLYCRQSLLTTIS